jgi:hypothetical protein
MITPSYAVTATERVLPRMALDFTTGVLDPRVTVTRALNTATRINSSGFVEIVNANLPRFDYDPVTLAPKGLLIEEARTNLAQQSSDYNTGFWSKTSVSLTTGIDDPAGGTSATTLTATAASGLIQQAVAGGVSSTTYSASFWIRRRTGTGQISLRCGDLTLIPITVTSSWVRYTVTAVASTATVRLAVVLTTSGDAVDVWGAQIEAGAFATSYIPTLASQVTRNADVVSMTGTNFSDWYNQAAGAFAVSFDRIAAMSASFSGGQPRTLRVTNTGATDFFILGGNSSFGEQLIGRASGVDTVSIQTGVQITANTVATECFGYAVNNFALSVNGASAQTDVSGANPATMDVLHIGDGVTATRNINGHVRKISYWPQRITNAEVQAFSKG